MKSYIVNYERIEDGWWLATVKGVRGCLTQGRTLKQTRQRIKEALSLFVENIEIAEFIDDIKLSAKAKKALSELKTNRERVSQENIKLQDSANKAVSLLIGDMGISLRDAGELLGLSHQRIHQIMHEENLEKH